MDGDECNASELGRSCDSESIISDSRIALKIVQAKRYATILAVEIPRTASKCTKWILCSASWIRRAIFTSSVIVRGVPIVGPLPHIADHVIEPQCIRQFAANRMRAVQ